MSYDKVLIQEDVSIKDALKKLDKTAEKTLLVVNKDGVLLGTITDGDIRRFILKGGKLEDCIRGTYNDKPAYLSKDDFSLDKVKDILLRDKIELIPMVDSENKVIDFVNWKQAFSGSGLSAFNLGKANAPVVIMAGGKSVRLEPFTKILPKALIPIGDKPVLEIIIDEFRKRGPSRFYLVLNYKADIIESYFNNIEKGYRLEYVREDEFFGTAGGLRLLKDELDDVFIVSNCDVIVKANFEEVVNFHKESKAALTILSSFQHYKIPYGIVKFKKGGEVIDIHEKPEYTFTVNTGAYVLSREALDLIPANTHFDMTDLIKEMIRNRKKIFTYPVNENDYTDIGQWEEYTKAISKLQHVI